MALLYKQERLPQIPKISEKDRKRQKRSLGVFMERCAIQGMVPVGGGRGLCELWEVEFIRGVVSDSGELKIITLIFSGMFLNVFKQKKCCWLGSSCPAPAAPAVTGILLHVQVHPG